MRIVIVFLLLALYVSAAYNNTLAAELSKGFLYDVAGDFYDGDGENKDQAYFTAPSAIAYDSTRNLMYVSDTYSNIVRVIDMGTNIITTIAGIKVGLPVSMSQLFYPGPDDAKKLYMNAPYGLAVDEVANKLYIAALTSNTVFVLDRASGIMETFAGSPYSRGTTIASTAKASLLSSPQGLFFDAANNYLYIADSGSHVVLQVNAATNVMTVFVGTLGVRGAPSDGTQATQINAPISILIRNGKMYMGTQEGLYEIDMSTKIIKTLHSVSRPVTGLTYLGGKIYACSSTNHYIFSVDLTNNNAVNTLVSGGNDVQGYVEGSLSQARYNRLYGIVANTNDGNLYIADTDNRAVRRLSITDNSVTTWAGDKTNGDGRLATKARLYMPYAAALNTLTYDTLYVSDNNQNIIRAINLTSNTISTIAGISMQQAATYNDGDGGPATSAKLNAPVSLLFDPSQNKLYIAESVNWAIRVIDLATGIISNYAGDGAYTQNIQADNTPLSSSIVNGPKGLALDVNNNKMYFAETYFNIIARVVDRATNTVSTLYGSPNSGFTDQSGSVASIRGIGAMEYDSLRNVLYVSDAESIKKVDLTARNVTTLADISLYPPYQMDATANGFAIDYARNVLYFTNAYTYQVSALDLADGSSIYPIAGKELKSEYNGTNGLALSLPLNVPIGLQYDSKNDILYVVDQRNNVVRGIKLRQPVVTPTTTPTPTPTPTTTTDTPTPTPTTTTETPTPTPTTTTETPTPTTTTETPTPTPTTTTDTPTPTPTTTTETPTPTPTTTETPTPTTETPTPTPTTTTETPTPTPTTTTDTPTPTPTSTTETPTPTTTETPTPTEIPTTTTTTPTTTETPTSTPTTEMPTSTNTPTQSTTTDTPTPVPTTPTDTPTTAPTTSIAPTSTVAQTTTTAPTTTVAPTTSAVPTTTASPTTTGAPVSSCIDSNGKVCNNAGTCVSGQCQCYTPTSLGRHCEINMQSSSSSYVAFDSSTNTGSANMDVANTIPGNTGTATFQLASTHATLSNTFGQSETGRKGVCLNPSYLIAGVQIFVAFELPKVIPSGAAVETWLNDASGKYSLNAAVRNVNGGLVFSLVIGADSSSVSVSLNTNTYYVLLISVDAPGGFATAQIVNTLNEAQATVDVYVSDDTLAGTLASEPYFICMSLSSTTGRVIRAVKDMAVNVRYYGRQNVGTAGTLKLKGATGITAGGIAGAVIGSILGCLLLTTIAVVAVLVIRYVLSRKVPVTKEHVELKDLENPNDLLPVAPVEEEHVYDTLPVAPVEETTQEVVATEVVVTPEDVLVEQEPVVVSPEETHQVQEPASVSPSEEEPLQS